jgi:hypothetical protein
MGGRAQSGSTDGQSAFEENIEYTAYIENSSADEVLVLITFQF